jgi:hypothetical protein
MFQRLFLGPLWYGVRIHHSDGRVDTELFPDKVSLGIYLLAHRDEGDIEDIRVFRCRAHSYEGAKRKMPCMEPSPC